MARPTALAVRFGQDASALAAVREERPVGPPVWRAYADSSTGGLGSVVSSIDGSTLADLESIPEYARDILAVGAEIWYTGSGTGLYVPGRIRRYRHDGSSAGADYTGVTQGFDFILDACVMGDLVWILTTDDVGGSSAGPYGGQVFRIHQDGTAVDGGAPFLTGIFLDPFSAMCAAGGNAWIMLGNLGGGDPFFRAGEVFRADGSFVGDFIFPPQDPDNPWTPRLQPIGDEVWAVDCWGSHIRNTTVFRFRIADRSLIASFIVPRPSETFNGHCRVGDVVWFQFHDGTVYRYSLDGVLIDTLSLPAGPGGVEPPTVRTSGALAAIPWSPPTFLPTVASVWAADDTSSAISLFGTDGSVAGPHIVGNGLDGPVVPLRVGAQVWVTNGNVPTISRFHLDGTSAGSTLTGNGLNFPGRMAIVAGVVWVPNSGAATISLFNTDGSSAGSPLTGNGLDGPYAIGTIGGVIWVANLNPTPCTVSLFNPDGSSAGSPLTVAGSFALLDIVPVAGQVWLPDDAIGVIWRLNPDGSTAASPITLAVVRGLALVGSEVWAPHGFPATAIARFNPDGSSAGADVTGGGMADVDGVAQVS